jgi:hypothetical protein
LFPPCGALQDAMATIATADKIYFFIYLFFIILYRYGISMADFMLFLLTGVKINNSTFLSQIMKQFKLILK